MSLSLEAMARHRSAESSAYWTLPSVGEASSLNIRSLESAVEGNQRAQVEDANGTLPREATLHKGPVEYPTEAHKLAAYWLDAQEALAM